MTACTDDERREVARSCDRCEYRPVCSTRRTCRDFAWCCSAYKKRIDRYTLLALADVLEVHARKIAQVRALINDKEQKRIFDDLEGCLLDIAACIREALGVTS